MTKKAGVNSLDVSLGRAAGQELRAPASVTTAFGLARPPACVYRDGIEAAPGITMTNETILVRCKWTPGQLDGKTVEFQCRLRDGGAMASGTGRFNVWENREGLLSVLMDRTLPGRSWDGRVCQRVFVPREGADAIEKHRSGQKDCECLPKL